MALFTSTPKSRLQIEETVSLLSLDSDYGDLSSGYDSPPEHYGRKHKTCRRRLDTSDSSDDYTSSSNCASSTEGDDDAIPPNKTMKVTSMHTLVDNIRYILSMPALCDVVFLVGPDRVPVYGLRAILSTRSRMFFTLFLRHSKEATKEKKKNKKTKQHTDYGNKLSIIIDNYDPDVFRTFVEYVHCGSVCMDPAIVTGLVCLASEFDIPDLKEACWKFVDKCIPDPGNASVMMKQTFRYSEHKAAQRLRLAILRFPTTTKETTPRNTERNKDKSSSNSDLSFSMNTPKRYSNTSRNSRNKSNRRHDISKSCSWRNVNENSHNKTNHSITNKTGLSCASVETTV